MAYDNTKGITHITKSYPVECRTLVAGKPRAKKRYNNLKTQLIKSYSITNFRR